MTTYTIAHHCDIILAIVPDGRDAMAEALRINDVARLNLTKDDIEVKEGLILTDDMPADRSKLFWTDRAILEDEDGRTFKYAVCSTDAPEQ